MFLRFLKAQENFLTLLHFYILFNQCADDSTHSDKLKNYLLSRSTKNY